MNSFKLSYFDITWFSTKDGQAPQVVLFLQGCHLRCPWCHSPHSWEIPSPLLFFAERCILCGACIGICPKQVHQIIKMRHIINRCLCIQCGACLKNCPASRTGTWNSNALAVLNHIINYGTFSITETTIGIIKKNGRPDCLRW